MNTSAAAGSSIASRAESPRNWSKPKELVGSMMSVDFNQPLTGQARAEKLKQMANKHVSSILISHLIAFCELVSALRCSSSYVQR